MRKFQGSWGIDYSVSHNNNAFFAIGITSPRHRWKELKDWILFKYTGCRKTLQAFTKIPPEKGSKGIFGFPLYLLISVKQVPGFGCQGGTAA